MRAEREGESILPKEGTWWEWMEGPARRTTGQDGILTVILTVDPARRWAQPQGAAHSVLPLPS